MDIMKIFGSVFGGGGATASTGAATTTSASAAKKLEDSYVIVERSKASLDVAERASKRISWHDFRASVSVVENGEDEENAEVVRIFPAVAKGSSLDTEDNASVDSATKHGSSAVAVPEQISGHDWESVDYSVSVLPSEASRGEEVTAMDVSDRYLALQYFSKPRIDVFDPESGAHLFSLLGHSYGGQCVRLAGDILYSGSMDKTVRSWNLSPAHNQGSRLIETIYNHVDYVQSVAVLRDEWVATGGRGDKAIFVYETDNKGKLWRRHNLSGHEGWVTQLLFVDSTLLVSGSEDSSLRLWDLRRGVALRSLAQDDAITCLALVSPDVLLFGDRAGKLSFLQMDAGEDGHDRDRVLHLLPNTLIGTGKYCRSSKYHDKAVDVVHVTGNGFMITASSGSKFLKVWRLRVGSASSAAGLEATDVTELQILREHSEFLTTFAVSAGTIFSTSADGQILTHTFPSGSPHYEMATEQEDKQVATGVINHGSLTTSPESPTAVCEGPRACRTGKTGLVRSSSSFQVSFKIKPRTVKSGSYTASVRLPATVVEEDDSGHDENDSDSDEEEDDDEQEESSSDFEMEESTSYSTSEEEEEEEDESDA